MTRNPKKCQGRQVLFGVCKLLPLVCSWICWHYIPIEIVNQKTIEWHWGPVQHKAFSELQFDLCNAPLLIFLDPKLPYTVVTDALADATGGVLMQDQGDGL